MPQILRKPSLKHRVAPAAPVRVPLMESASPVLTLRAMTPDDVPALARLIERDAVHLFRWLPVPDGCRDAAQIALRWVNRAIEGGVDGSAWRRLATLQDGTIVGSVNLIRIERGLDWQADMNWWVSSIQSGRGIGTQLVRNALAHAFADMPEGLGLHRVHAGIQPGNRASLRLAHKTGFVANPSLNSKLLVNDEWQLHRGFVARV